MTDDPGIGTEALNLLSLCDLFSDLDPSALDNSQIAHLAQEISVIHLQRGDVLLKQGDVSDCMYAVIRGKLHVLVEGPDGQPNLVGELRSGETVGELGLIDGSVRMATVRAIRDSQLVRISSTGFEMLVRSNPESLSRIARSEAERMRAMGQGRSPLIAVRTITVIGAAGGTGVGDFTTALCSALSKIGSVLYFNKARFEALYRRTFDINDGMASWLSELERGYRFVVFEADADRSPWTMHTLRQADRILAVSDASSLPDLSDVERAVFDEYKEGRTADLELVLLHQTSSFMFSATARWMEPRTVARHHHVRSATGGDVGRVARLVAGRSIGLTLGGGGARGFAHIGVLRAIEEAGIPVDMINGVSMGAIIAGLYAMGRNWQEIMHLAKREMTSKLTSDFALPIVSLSSGRRFRRALESFYGKTAIEDLAISFFCTSCNLSTSEMVIHRTGSLADAVYASNAIPGILPPFLSNGHMLIDGGVLNNQPGDVMKALCGGSVIVVGVSPRREATVDASFLEMPSAWRILRSRINPFEQTIRVPGISATVMRTLMVASERKSREVERMADFYLRPPVDAFRVDGFEQIEAIAAAGYEYARQEIRAWQESGRLNAIR